MVSRPQPYMDDPLAPLLRMVLSSRGTLLIDRNENSRKFPFVSMKMRHEKLTWIFFLNLDIIWFRHVHWVWLINGHLNFVWDLWPIYREYSLLHLIRMRSSCININTITHLLNDFVRFWYRHLHFHGVRNMLQWKIHVFYWIIRRQLL